MEWIGGIAICVYDPRPDATPITTGGIGRRRRRQTCLDQRELVENFLLNRSRFQRELSEEGDKMEIAGAEHRDSGCGCLPPLFERIVRPMMGAVASNSN